MSGVGVVYGFWGVNKIECCLINVYAPCELGDRVDLWDRVLQVIHRNPDCTICVAGDFNSVRFASERVGRRKSVCRRELDSFDGFIRSSRLIDLPLHGRLFTWYRPDGSCKSRLDRILVNNR